MTAPRLSRRHALLAMALTTALALVAFALAQPARAQTHGSDHAAPAAAGKPPVHGSGMGRGSSEGPGDSDGKGSGTPHDVGRGKAAHADGIGLHGEGAAHGGHHLPPINWTEFGKKTPPFVALLLNFGVLVFAYYGLGKKPVQKALVDRRLSVAREIDEANRLLREAEERAKVYQAKIANLEQEIETAKRSLTEAGKGDRDRILREANEKADRMKRDAKLLVEQEVKQLRQDLLVEAIGLASDSASATLKARVTQEDHERLATEFLTELSRQKRVNA